MYHTPPEINRQNEDMWFAMDIKTGNVLYTSSTLESLDRIAAQEGLYPTADYYKHSWVGKEIPSWSRHYKAKKTNNPTLEI